MNVLQIAGLLLTLLGGLLVAIPDIPERYDFLQRIQPLKSIRLAENKLYQGGRINQPDDGFEYISKALRKGSQPFDRSSDYGSFSGYSAVFELPEGEVEIKYKDCSVNRITREDEKPLSQSCFTVRLVPDDPEFVRTMKSHIGENGQLPVVDAEIPAGRLPEIITEYKKKVSSGKSDSCC